MSGQVVKSLAQRPPDEALREHHYWRYLFEEPLTCVIDASPPFLFLPPAPAPPFLIPPPPDLQHAPGRAASLVALRPPAAASRTGGR